MPFNFYFAYKWLYEEAYLELSIFTVFKDNNRMKISKIITLSCYIFILFLFSEKNQVCIYAFDVLK